MYQAPNLIKVCPLKFTHFPRKKRLEDEYIMLKVEKHFLSEITKIETTK